MKLFKDTSLNYKNGTIQMVLNYDFNWDFFWYFYMVCKLGFLNSKF